MSERLVWIGVALAGGLGAYGRYRVDAAITRRMTTNLPWGTFAVNISGALVAGLVAGTGLRGPARDLLVVGVLASFTTFSTWMLETQRLAEDGRTRPAVGNVVLGAGIGLVAACAGWSIGALL